MYVFRKVTTKHEINVNWLNKQKIVQIDYKRTMYTGYELPRVHRKYYWFFFFLENTLIRL